MLGLRIEITQDRHAVLHLVALDFLGCHEFNATFVDFTAEFLENVGLVVFAPETDNKNRSCIRVVNHIPQDFLGVLVVVSELGAAVVMRESEDIIRPCFLTETLGAFLDNTVYASYGRNNPHFVADTDLSVFAAIAHKSSGFIGNIQYHLFGVILIFEQSREVGFDIILVHPAAGFFRLSGVPDREAVLNDVLAFREIFDGYLVSGRHVFEDCDYLSVHFNNRPGGLRLYCYHHIVRRIDF